MGYRSGGYRRGGGPPGWLILLLSVAIVFGVFYLLRGAQDFIRTGGQGIEEATSRAQDVDTATAARVTRMATQPLEARATSTPQPECADFRVIVPNAVVREQPNGSAGIITGFNEGEIVCVLGRAPNPEWYVIDLNPETRRLDEAYMNEVVIEAINPTPTPLPTVTPMPSLTPSNTPLATDTPDVTPNVTATATRELSTARTLPARPTVTTQPGLLP